MTSALGRQSFGHGDHGHTERGHEHQRYLLPALSKMTSPGTRSLALADFFVAQAFRLRVEAIRRFPDIGLVPILHQVATS